MIRFKKINVWIKELRAPFFSASIIPVILGTSIAWWKWSIFNPYYFIAVLVGGISLHAGANIANDYFDYKNGSDNINKDFIRPFTGGSRMIQKGLMKPWEVLLESALFYLIALLIGIWLITELGIVILYLGLIGAFSGFFYTAPPFKFVSRGVGEIMIGINFGILLTFGSYFVQSQRIDAVPVIASIPVAILVSIILYINEFTDYKADKASGKLHLVARFGRRKSATGYAVIILFTYVYIICMTALGYIPKSGLLIILTIPLAIGCIKRVRKYYDMPEKMIRANLGTIQLHLFIGLILSLSYIISGILK